MGGGFGFSSSRQDPATMQAQLMPEQTAALRQLMQMFTGTPGQAATEGYYAGGGTGAFGMPGAPGTWVPGQEAVDPVQGILGQGAEAYGDAGQQLTPGATGLQKAGFEAISGLQPGGDIQSWIKNMIDKPISPVQEQMGSKVTDLLAGGGDLTSALKGEMGTAKAMGGPAFAKGMESLSRSLAPFSAEGTVADFRKYIEPEAKRMFEESLGGIMEPYAAKGATSSGAFNRALTGAGEDLTSKLMAQLGGRISTEKMATQAMQPGAQAQALSYFGAPQNLAMQEFGLGMGGEQALTQMGLGAGQGLESLGLQQTTGLGSLGLSGAGQEWAETQNMINNMLTGGGVQQQLAGMPGAPTGADIAAQQQQWQQGQAWANPWLQMLQPAMQTGVFSPVAGGGKSFGMNAQASLFG